MDKKSRPKFLGFSGFAVVFVLVSVGIASAYNGYGYNEYDRQMAINSMINDRIVQHLLAAVFGAFIGGFLSDKARGARRYLFLFFCVIGSLLGALLHVYIGNVAFFILGATIAYILLSERPDQTPREKPTTFGSAEWADLEHLYKNNLVGEMGFSLGVFPYRETNQPLHYTGDRHLLTVAPTRSGKGVSAIIPNLLTYEGSAIIIDPKGENALITAARRGYGDKEKIISGMGQTVHVVDPWGITGLPVSCFNPLDWLDPVDPDINENAMLLADSIITPHAGAHDQFWDEEAKALLMGILLWVALDPSEQENRTLGRVRDIISLPQEDLNNLLTEMSLYPNPVVSSAGARTLSKEDKLKSNVLASLQSHTHFLDSPRLRESLSTSDFDFATLKTAPTTIYLVLPADRLGAFGRWLRLLIQQALTINARNIEVKPEKPILFMLDEMAALGRLSMVEQAFGLMAGFGMQLWGIVQDLSQLQRIYGNGWQTFIGNSGVIQYFGSRDLMTAEYFSKLCGVTTVEKKSFSFSWTKGFSSGGGKNGGESSSSSSGGTATDVVQRNLVYPDELMVLRDNKEIVFIESANPIPARKIEWFKNPAIKRFGVNLHQKERDQEQRPLEAPVILPQEKTAEETPAPQMATMEDYLQANKEKLDSALQKGSEIIKNMPETLSNLKEKWRGR